MRGRSSVETTTCPRSRSFCPLRRSTSARGIASESADPERPSEVVTARGLHRAGSVRRRELRVEGCVISLGMGTDRGSPPEFFLQHIRQHNQVCIKTPRCLGINNVRHRGQMTSGKVVTGEMGFKSEAGLDTLCHSESRRLVGVNCMPGKSVVPRAVASAMPRVRTSG